MNNSNRYSFETQSIGLSSVVNARELGGYRMPDGSVIKRGKLLRGGALNRLSPEDLKSLVPSSLRWRRSAVSTSASSG